MLLFVDSVGYTDRQVRERALRFQAGRRSSGGANTGNLHAVCMKDPVGIVAAVRAARERQECLWLLGGEMPRAAALELAASTGVCRLSLEAGETVELEGRSIREPGLMQYSSGTGGRPKLVVRAWDELDAEIEQYNRALPAEPGDRPVVLVPVYHSYGLVTGILAALARGAVPIAVTDKNPRYALHLIDRTPNSLVYGVPALYHVLCSLARPSFRFYKTISSGAPLTGKLLERMGGLAETVIQQYGSSETGCLSLAVRPASACDVGEPLAHQRIGLVPISDCGGEGEGEVVAESRFRRVNTHDIGRFDERGRLSIIGRSDDLINVSGQKVLPAEVEQVIEGLEGVAEAVVFKGKHAVWGDTVLAWVVPAGELEVDRVRAWCLERLPAYKVPGRIRIVRDIPRTPYGKISRKQLQEEDEG